MNRVSSSSNSAGGYDQEKEEMVYCLILLAKGQTDNSPPPKAKAAPEVYRCKTCFKSFPSFQALGGHRTSHNKKATVDDEKKPLPSKDEREATTLSLKTPSTTSTTRTSTRVHECSVCGAGFVSGQALGGHMRRHRPMPKASKRPRNLVPLDLNLPAPPEDEDDDERESDFSFAEKERIIVFSASSPLIDCHH